MGLPTIPDIQPKIKLKRQDVIHLLLSSIAMEELSLSHILNAEGEKIQQVIAKHPSLQELLNLNYSVERTLRNTIKSQMMLQYKLEDLIDLVRMAKFQEDDDGWFPDEESLLEEAEEEEEDRENLDALDDREEDERDEAEIRKALRKFQVKSRKQ